MGTIEFVEVEVEAAEKKKKQKVLLVYNQSGGSGMEGFGIEKIMYEL